MGLLQEASEAGFERCFTELELDPVEFEKTAGKIMTTLKAIGQTAKRLTGVGSVPGAMTAGTHSMEGLAGRIATPGAVAGMNGIEGGTHAADAAVGRYAAAQKGADFRTARRAARAESAAPATVSGAMPAPPRMSPAAGPMDAGQMAGPMTHPAPPVHSPGGVDTGMMHGPEQQYGPPAHLAPTMGVDTGMMHGPDPSLGLRARNTLWNQRTEGQRRAIVGGAGAVGGMGLAHVFGGGGDDRRRYRD